MALSNADKKRRQADRKAKAGIVERAFPMAPGTWAKVQALCEAGGFSDWREVVTLLIHNAERVEVPRHPLNISEETFAKLYEAGRATKDEL